MRRYRAILFLAATTIALAGFGRLYSAGGGDKAPPKVDRQGDPLPDGAITRMGTTRWRHGDNIVFLAFPSDKTMLTVARDSTIRLWDRATGKEIRRFELPAAKAAQMNPQPGVAGRGMGMVRSVPNRVALSADGKIFAASLPDNSVQLWDVETGKELRRLKGPATGIADLLFSPNGKAIAVSSGDRSIHLIKTEDGDEICQIKGIEQKGPVRLVVGGRPFNEGTGLAFSPDGKTIASAEVEFGQQKTSFYLRLSDAETGKEIRKTEIDDGVYSIAFSPDGKIVAHGSGASVVFREADTGKEIRTVKNASGIALLLFSPDGKTLAAKGQDQIVRLYETDSGKTLHQLGEPAIPQQGGGNAFFLAGPVFGAGETRDLAFTRDSKSISVGGAQTPRLFNVGTGKDQPLAGGHRSGVSTLAISPDGKTMVSRGADHAIRRWDAHTGEELGQFIEPAGSLAAAVSPDTKMIALANADGTIRIHSVETGKQLHKVKGHANGTAALVFSADSKTLASRGGNDNTIRLFDAAKGNELRAIAIPSNAQAMGGNVVVFGGGNFVPTAQGLAFSPDGACIATSVGVGPQQAVFNGGGMTGRPDNMIRVWDIATGKETRQIKVTHVVTGLAYSPDGRLLAAQNSDQSVSLWEIASGKERALLGESTAAPQPPQGGMGGLVVIGGAGFGPVRASAPAGPSIAFSPNGEWLAARAKGNAVRVFEVASAREAGQFKGHVGDVAAVAFAPDGKALATGSADTTILVWDANKLKRESPAAAELSEERLKSLWTDLADGSAAKAGLSIRALAAGAKESTPFLAGRLKPAAAIDAKIIDQWITDLDSGNFQKRNKAAQELEKIGELARPALKKILASEPSPETRRRAEPLLEKLVTGSLTAEQLQLVRAIETLERSGNAEARRVLESLTRGAPGALPTREAEAALGRMKK